MTDSDSKVLPPRPGQAVEGHHESYEVVVSRAASAEDILAEGYHGIGAVPITDQVDLQFYGRIISSKTLHVVFHGATKVDGDVYPRFDRVPEHLGRDDNFISFADPTLTIDPAMTLGWYLGTAKWDPAEQIERSIRAAQAASGASEVVFIGGAGGGFAALRYARYFPNSLAFVFSPQTAAYRYEGGHLPKLLEMGYDGLSVDECERAFPRRFEVVSDYSDSRPNYVYYLQNLNDPGHIKDHYNPFRRALCVSAACGNTADGRVRFVLADQEKQGHGSPKPYEFDEQFDLAINYWAAAKGGSPSDHAPADVPALCEDEHSVAELAQRFKELSDFAHRSHRAIMRELGTLPSTAENFRRLAGQYIPDGDRSAPPTGSFALRTESVVELTDRVRVEAPDTVVECGSGSSTAWIALALEQLGAGHVYSLEHDVHYGAGTAALVDSVGVGHRATVVHAPLADRKIAGTDWSWYSQESIDELPEKIDLLLVDGPPASVGPRSRFPALPVLKARLRPSALVLVDDVSRPDEKAVIELWSKNGELELIAEGKEMHAFRYEPQNGEDA